MILSFLGEGNEPIFSEFALRVLKSLETVNIAVAGTLDDERRLSIAICLLVIL